MSFNRDSPYQLNDFFGRVYLIKWIPIENLLLATVYHTVEHTFTFINIVQVPAAGPSRTTTWTSQDAGSACK